MRTAVDYELIKEDFFNAKQWILEEVNEKFTKDADQYSDINDIKDCYLEELKKYIEMLKRGLYK
ncbi:hypothetical protein [Clostridium sp. Cult1]|uniref:hypothetical protein n=1 Tax=Clostridium sp. Cult1 TaxID=2079002 RepID=UPI001F1B69D5|nr:hypothetical protein [Clostridium sp. Cult1]MCF6461991.1 hypothetical protein [Clostridium sp. Cult1]